MMQRRLWNHRAKRIAVSLLLGLLLIAGWLGVFSSLSRADDWEPRSAGAVTKIYWTDQASGGQTGEIWRSNADGSATERLVSGLDTPRGIELDTVGNRMYWTDRRQGRIQRAALDGSNVTNFCSGLTTPDDIWLDPSGQQIYWTENTANLIRRSPLSSCSPQTILDGLDGVSSPVGVAVDVQNGKIYWVEFTPPRVRRADLGGSNIETLISTGILGPLEIVLDVPAGFMYIVDRANNIPGSGRILRATLSGSNLMQIGPNMESPRGIALDLSAGHIYWIDFGFHTLSRMNLNGSGVTTIKSSGDSLSDPRSLALQFGPSVTCYPLSLRHEGLGSDPIASPPGSAGCPSGQYQAGSAVSLVANPAQGWTVERWSGTINDNSTFTTNSTIMPEGPHVVTVYYKTPDCYPLTLGHEGQGSDPIASPTNSPSCPLGQYGAGIAVIVSALPAASWRIDGWTGTIDDSSLAPNNIAVMPDGPHSVTVRYVFQAPAVGRLLLPSIITMPAVPPSCFQGDFEIEPNNERAQANVNGPFCFGRNYRGLPTDNWDIFAFNVDAPGRVSAEVVNHRSTGTILYLADTAGKPLVKDEIASDGLRFVYDVVTPGRYYVAIYVPSPNVDETAQYTLQVMFQ